MGCGTGEHAPGLRLDVQSLEACWRNFRRAHNLAYEALRQADPENRVGLASTGRVFYPASQRPEDAEAARRMTFGLSEGVRTYSHALALEGVDKLDFIGVNLYHGAPARMGENGPEIVPFPAGWPRTAMDWPVTPEAMEWGLRFLGERYHKPLYVNENGLACADKVFLDGQVHDPGRMDFLTQYLRALERALEGGADVRGYFHWSLTDNFEWAEGYDRRFGLAYVDYATGERLLKDSGRWFGTVARSNGASLY